jgi:hypothetical protein
VGVFGVAGGGRRVMVVLIALSQCELYAGEVKAKERYPFVVVICNRDPLPSSTPAAMGPFEVISCNDASARNVPTRGALAVRIFIVCAATDCFFVGARQLGLVGCEEGERTVMSMGALADVREREENVVGGWRPSSLCGKSGRRVSKAR